MRVCASKNLSPAHSNCSSTDRFKAVPLLKFLCFYAPVVSYVAFALSFLFLIFASPGACGRLRFIIVAFLGYLHLQSNLDSPNTDGSFTTANSNSFLSPYEIYPIDQENKYLRKLSYFIMELYVVCTH